MKKQKSEIFIISVPRHGRRRIDSWGFMSLGVYLASALAMLGIIKWLVF